jgi:hypothetical protein
MAWIGAFFPVVPHRVMQLAVRSYEVPTLSSSLIHYGALPIECGPLTHSQQIHIGAVGHLCPSVGGSLFALVMSAFVAVALIERFSPPKKVNCAALFNHSEPHPSIPC